MSTLTITYRQGKSFGLNSFFFHTFCLFFWANHSNCMHLSTYIYVIYNYIPPRDIKINFIDLTVFLYSRVNQRQSNISTTHTTTPLILVKCFWKAVKNQIKACYSNSIPKTYKRNMVLFSKKLRIKYKRYFYNIL